MERRPVGDCVERRPAGDCVERRPVGDCVERRPVGDCVKRRPVGDCVERRPVGDCVKRRPVGDCVKRRRCSMPRRRRGEKGESPSGCGVARLGFQDTLVGYACGENVADVAPLFTSVSQGPSCSTDLDLAHINMVGVA